MSKQSFIKGTLILLGAGIITRILGFIPRIALPRVIGAEGVGLYQLGWPFLVLILTLISGGIPLAVSKLIAQAEAEGNERRVSTILRIALTFSVILATILTTLSYTFAPWITKHLLTDPRVYYTFMCMGPVILIASVSAVYRGYFQGRHNMIPTASSQIAETTIRIIMILLFSFLMLPYGIHFAAAGAMVGVMIGELGGIAVLYFYYRQGLKNKKRSAVLVSSAEPSMGRLNIFKQLLSISIPVTGNKLIGATSYLVESILIAKCLAIAGVATALATAQYGALQGMVIPILLLPTALTYSLSTVLIPSLSEAAAHKDTNLIHSRMNQSLRLALVSGAPFAVIMFVLASPLTQLMYNNAEVGIMLKMMAPVALFIYLQAPLQAALQVLDRPGTALFNTLISATVKLALIYFLVRQPEIGIKGAIIAINANTIIVTILHLFAVQRALKFTVNGYDMLKVCVAMTVSGLLCNAVMEIPWTASEGIRFFAACIIALATYLFMILILKLINRSDLSRILRMGRKIVKT
ncbi:stage V sporulation protein B [Paenibacillus sp. N1-5-1-14]|uniref:stage V sporulation protein B n=1 Tax=Paenibacillus radicibacter TaxID=2972488 RepID=UPI0021592A33|nr:stage V sporulation protein B [Paenibacillus radicibacter]MCR8644108.1 stage V sporulation protein B [Paenibacillus radicibacter]